MLFDGRGLARAVAEYIFAQVPSQLFVAQKLVREIGLLWDRAAERVPPIGVNLNAYSYFAETYKGGNSARRDFNASAAQHSAEVGARRRCLASCSRHD